MVIPQLRWFDLRGHLRVDVVTVTDVMHPTATAGNDSLNLLSLIHLRRLVPVYGHGWRNLLSDVRVRFHVVQVVTYL